MDGLYFAQRVLEEYDAFLTDNMDVYGLNLQKIAILLSKVKDIVYMQDLKDKHVYAKVGKEDVQKRREKYKTSKNRFFYDLSFGDVNAIMQIRKVKDKYMKKEEIYFSIIFDTKEKTEFLFRLVYEV